MKFGNSISFFFNRLHKKMDMFMNETFQDADSNNDGMLNQTEMEAAIQLSQMPQYFTVGRSGCPYTVKQAVSNNAGDKNVSTIFCGDPSVMQTYKGTKYENICNSLPKLEGVPANFTCDTNANDPSECKIDLGFNPDFGKGS